MPLGKKPFSRQAYLTTDQLSDVASGTSLRVDCLSPASGLSHIRQISHPGRWGFDSIDLAAHVRADGGMEKGMVAFLFIERAQGSSIAGKPLSDQMVLGLPPGGEIRASMRRGAVYRGIVVPIADWLAVQQQAVGFVRTDYDEPSLLRLTTSKGSALFEETTCLANRLEATVSNTVPAFETQSRLPLPLIDCLGHLAEFHARAQDGYEAVNRSVDARLRQASCAKDFILAHLAEDLSIDRLCTIVNVSRRQLEYAFRTTFDCSPGEFIQSVRLNEIRRQLRLGGGRKVTEIALDNGMQHLSRFSAAYRSLFGELPKETARRGITVQGLHGSVG